MIGCHGTNGDCLPDVVVERPCEPVVSSVFTALDTKDKVKIAEAFATGRDVLIKYVSEAYVDGVIAGTLYAESDYGTETARMLLIRSKEDVLAVYPLLPEKS